MIVAQTPRLDIRPWTDSQADLDRVWDMYSRWEVMRYLGSAPRVMAEPAEAATSVQRWREQSAQWLGEYGAWAIEDRETGRVAGTVLLKPMPNSDGSPATDIEVGWHLHPDSWGHGYATEAAQALLDKAFSAGVPEVFAVVYPENTASLAVCRRLGMESTGETERWYGIRCAAFRIRPGMGV
jgi:RimJ/RimL family protein N-acetyltransferase